MPTLCSNKRARHDYEILETFEAGLVLTGQETKAVKNGQMSLAGSFVHIRNGRAQLQNAQIMPYKFAGNIEGYDPIRNRALLLHKRELTRLQKKLDAERLTLVPLSAYTAHGLVKLELALARGKQAHDKRRALKKKELDREIRTRQYHS
ncbi:MAG: SsrA-binding protein SmpB [Patescibacteria group bacterium]